MGSRKWLVALLGCSLMGVAAADDQGTRFLLTPFVGAMHIGVDGSRRQDGESRSMDQMLLGFRVGVRLPAGLQFDITKSDADSEKIFDWFAENYSLNQVYATVGYSFELPDKWRFTPKVGYGEWRVRATWVDFIDPSGEEHELIKGDDFVYEVELSRDISDVFTMGLSLQGADVPFGSAYSAAITTSWRF